MNPLLTTQIPGKTFALPSKGIIYPEGVIDSSVTDGEIHIFPLSGLTELNLKNPDLLFNGKAIVTVFNECVPEIKKPLELAAKDVDAILFFLRLVTYGPEFRIEVKHTCENAKDHSYAVDLHQVLNKMKNIDPTTYDNISVTNVDDKQVIVRPIKFTDVIKLFQETGTKKEFNTEEIRELALTNYCGMISSVNGITDEVMIREWLNTLTTPQLNKISTAASSVNDWGIDGTVSLKCRDCGSMMDVELPLNPINFFND